MDTIGADLRRRSDAARRLPPLDGGHFDPLLAAAAMRIVGREDRLGVTTWIASNGLRFTPGKYSPCEFVWRDGRVQIVDLREESRWAA